MLTDQKVRVALPKDAKEARELDRHNGNALWTDVLQGAIRNAKVAFKTSEGGKRPQVTIRLLNATHCGMQ